MISVKEFCHATIRSWGARNRNLVTGKNLPNDAFANSPVHRFYQMWQQFDCDASHISRRHPNGCLSDLFVWTEVTVGSNNN